MLYLMMDKRENEYLVKVGYSKGTGGIPQRRAQYYSHNPRAIMRSSCAGSRAIERDCHTILAENGCERIPRTEWFSVSKAVFDELYVKGLAFFLPKQKNIHFLEEYT